MSTELLDPGGTDALVLAADALLVGASVLTDLHARDEALGAIQVVARAAAVVPEDRHAERMDDILDMARAEVLAECGDVYNGCLLAEEVMRRHEKVSPVLAARGRRLLGISSMEVGQFDEAITQFREQANIMLAAGITLYAVASLLSLGSALEASERYLESAEVLESALSLAQRAGAGSIALYLHRLLAQTGMAMGEEDSVAEHSLAAARILQDQGRRALAGEYLSHAAMAASNLKDNVRAATLFRQAADLEDTRTDQGCLDPVAHRPELAGRPALRGRLRRIHGHRGPGLGLARSVHAGPPARRARRARRRPGRLRSRARPAGRAPVGRPRRPGVRGLHRGDAALTRGAAPRPLSRERPRTGQRSPGACVDGVSQCDAWEVRPV